MTKRAAPTVQTAPARRRFQRPWQLARLASVSLGARLAPTASTRARALDRVVAQLGRMHGLPQKIGQILASAELDGSAARFAELTAHRASAVSGPEARRVVAELLGRPLDEVFSEFDSEGIAASIGQVHRARLRNGRSVAVKFQHRGIADTLEADLRALGWLVSPLGNLRRDFDLASYRAELAERLTGELDYSREAAALHEFAALHEGEPDVVVPASCEELRRPGLLVLSWLEGADIEAARHWTPTIRQALAETLVRLFLRGALRDGLLHADPHPGNYRFIACGPQSRPAVGLLDFGSMHRMRPAESAALAEALHHARHGSLDEAFAWRFHLDFGYDPNLLAPLRSRLPEILRVLLAPVAQAGVFDLARWHPGEALAQVLGPQRIAYRIAAPPSFLFLIRAWHGLVHYLRALEQPVDWSALADPLIASAATIRPAKIDRQEPVLPRGPLLHLQVVQDERELVRLRLPAKSVDQLSALIPAEHRPRLDAQGFSPAKVAAQAQATGYAPQELYRLSQPGRLVRIWLE